MALVLALCPVAFGHTAVRARGCAPARFTSAGSKPAAVSARAIARDANIVVLQLRLRNGGENTIVCARRSGKFFYFVSPHAPFGSEGPPEVYPGHAAVAGARAAAVVVGADEAGPYESIVVLSVSGNRANRNAVSINTQVWDPSYPSAPLGAAAVALRPDGAVAVGVCDTATVGGVCSGASPWQAILAVQAGSSSITTLAQGADVNAASLALTGSQLTWTQGGQMSAAQLP